MTETEIDIVLQALAVVERRLAARLDVLERRDPVPGRDGRDGTNGRDGAPGEKGIDGRDGRDGAPGEKGADGRDGIDGRDGLRGDDGLAGRDGTNGIDGQDGLGFDDLRLEPDPVDDRVQLLVAQRGDQVKTLGRIVSREVRDAGTYDATTAYRPGDGVTQDGGFWIAQVATSRKPGSSPDWRLAVKRGAAGPKGDAGKDGRAGRDLVAMDRDGRKW